MYLQASERIKVIADEKRFRDVHVEVAFQLVLDTVEAAKSAPNGNKKGTKRKRKNAVVEEEPEQGSEESEGPEEPEIEP